MIAALIRWSCRNVMLVLLATLFLVGSGVYAVMRMPLDAIPDLSDAQVILYLEITLLDRKGEVLYQGYMVPSLWNVSSRFRNSFIHNETFHVVARVPPPEGGMVRVFHYSRPLPEGVTR